MTLPQSGHFVLNGFDDLTYRLAEQLSGRYGSEVVVVMTHAQRLSGRDFAELSGVSPLVVERLDEDAWTRAHLTRAAGLALTAQDDVNNIHLALQARDLSAQTRLVIRMYHTDLGHRVEQLLGNCQVISDAEIAAPELVALAFGEVAASPVQVAQRVLVVAQRENTAVQDIVCALADTAQPDGPHVLPGDDGKADLVLAHQRQPLSLLETTHGWSKLLPPKRSRFSVAITLLSALVSRKTRIAIGVVLAIIAVSGFVLSRSLGLSTWDGFYTTAITVFGGLQPGQQLRIHQQVLQLLLGLAGLAFLPLVTAMVVEGSVRARFAVEQAKLQQPRAGHLVVVGLGGVGARILRLLHDRGAKLIAIAQAETDRGVAVARDLDIPLIIGDPSRETILRQASADRCRALIAVDRSDVVNLQTALQGRNLQPNMRVVLRLFDADLAERVRRLFDLPLSRSVSYVAVPAFAEALMDREVIGTIAVDRRILLIAEVHVKPGSTLSRQPIGTINKRGQVQVIAVTAFGEPRPLWRPAISQQLRAGDKIIVVATRDGLSGLTGQP